MKVTRVVTFGTLWYNMGKVVAHIYLHLYLHTEHSQSDKFK